jgi:hypothetical protein
MQLLLMLPGEIDDVEVADRVKSQGIGISALSPLHLTPRLDRGLLLGLWRSRRLREIDQRYRRSSQRERAAGKDTTAARPKKSRAGSQVWPVRAGG